MPPRPSAGDGGDAVRVQILATEHWSLLATRGMTWSEIFSRTATFLTVLSATVIALSLVAQGTRFGAGFQVFAVLVLPVALMIGVATYLRLVEADLEDAWLVLGMNRLRHAYLELAPDLEVYFITSRHDDESGLLRTYAFRDTVGISHLLAGSPVIVGLVNVVLSGVLAAIVALSAGLAVWLQLAIGVAAGLATALALGVLGHRRIVHMRDHYHPRFPTAG